jgi:hypothetical protein
MNDKSKWWWERAHGNIQITKPEVTETYTRCIQHWMSLHPGNEWQIEMMLRTRARKYSDNPEVTDTCTRCIQHWMSLHPGNECQIEMMMRTRVRKYSDNWTWSKWNMHKVYSTLDVLASRAGGRMSRARTIIETDRHEEEGKTLVSNHHICSSSLLYNYFSTWKTTISTALE